VFNTGAFVTPSTFVNGGVGTITFEITPTIDIPTGGHFRIEFPKRFFDATTSAFRQIIEDGVYTVDSFVDGGGFDYATLAPVEGFQPSSINADTLDWTLT